ncbi:MAG: hypothetical protein K8F56_06545 [Rhodocyclaceae bacterium]|nr:hypothetical protein [Rhodocyclaceae bacterium]
MIGLQPARRVSKVPWPLLATIFVVSCASDPSGHWAEIDEALAGVDCIRVKVSLDYADFLEPSVYEFWPDPSHGTDFESWLREDEIRDVIRRRASAALRAAGIKEIEAESANTCTGRDGTVPEETLNFAVIHFEFTYGAAFVGPSYLVKATASQTATLGRDPSKYVGVDFGLWVSIENGSKGSGRSLGSAPQFEKVIAWLQRDVDSILEQVVASALSGTEGAQAPETPQRAGRWDWLMDVADRAIIGFIVGGLVAIWMLAKSFVKRRSLKGRKS